MGDALLFGSHSFSSYLFFRWWFSSFSSRFIRIEYTYIHMKLQRLPHHTAPYTLHIQWMRCLSCLSFFYSFILHVHIPFYIYMASAVLRAAPALLLLLLVFFLLLDCGVDIDSHSHWLYGCDFRFVARHFAFLNPNKISLWFRTIFIIFNVNTIKTTTGNMILSLPANQAPRSEQREKKFHDVSDYLSGDSAFDSMCVCVSA